MFFLPESRRLKKTKPILPRRKRPVLHPWLLNYLPIYACKALLLLPFAASEHKSRPSSYAANQFRITYIFQVIMRWEEERNSKAGPSISFIYLLSSLSSIISVKVRCREFTPRFEFSIIIAAADNHRELADLKAIP